MYSLSLVHYVSSIDCFTKLAPILHIVIVYRVIVPMVGPSKTGVSRYHRLSLGQQAPIGTSQVIEMSVFG